MSGFGRRFDPAELRTTSAAGDATASDADLAEAVAMARDLEALMSDDAVRPTDGFEDRVMLAIAEEPAPRLVIASAGGRVAGFVAAVGTAWAVATGGGRPVWVRAQALGFVLLVVVAAGLLTTATAITVGGLLERRLSPAPSVPPSPITTPTPSPTPSPPAVAPSPTATDDPRETAEPGETSGPTRSPRPTETAEPTETDDHGGGGGDNSGPGGGSDDGGGNSGPGGGSSPGGGSGPD